MWRLLCLCAAVCAEVNTDHERFSNAGQDLKASGASNMQMPGGVEISHETDATNPSTLHRLAKFAAHHQPTSVPLKDFGQCTPVPRDPRKRSQNPALPSLKADPNLEKNVNNFWKFFNFATFSVELTQQHYCSDPAVAKERPGCAIAKVVVPTLSKFVTHLQSNIGSHPERCTKCTEDCPFGNVPGTPPNTTAWSGHEHGHFRPMIYPKTGVRPVPATAPTRPSAPVPPWISKFSTEEWNGACFYTWTTYIWAAISDTNYDGGEDALTDAKDGPISQAVQQALNSIGIGTLVWWIIAIIYEIVVIIPLSCVEVIMYLLANPWFDMIVLTMFAVSHAFYEDCGTCVLSKCDKRKIAAGDLDDPNVPPKK